MALYKGICLVPHLSIDKTCVRSSVGTIGGGDERIMDGGKKFLPWRYCARIMGRRVRCRIRLYLTRKRLAFRRLVSLTEPIVRL